MGRTRYLTSLFMAAYTMTVTLPAGAQHPAPSPTRYPACSTPPSSQDVSIAKQTYELAVRRFNEGDYNSAIVYFKDAYRSDCTAHKLLTNLARAYELTGDRGEAIKALETYLERGNPSADDRSTVERRIRNLKDSAGESAPPSPAQPAGVGTPPPVAPQPSPAPSVPPVSATGYVTSVRGAPTYQRDRGHTAPPWILVGIGGAALVTGAVLFALGVHDVSAATSACPTRTNCAADVASQGNRGRTFEPVGLAVGLVGLGAIGGGLVWHFFEPVNRNLGVARVVPSFGPSHVGLSFDTHF